MESLIADIETFCRSQGISERQFGELSLSDGKLVAQLRAGRDIRFSTMQRIRDWMAAYRSEAA